MHWDHFFEELEGELASVQDTHRAILESESERLRIARLPLHTRVAAMVAARHASVLELVGGERLRLTLHDAGADWVAGTPADGRSLVIVPTAAITGMTLGHDSLDESLHGRAPRSSLRRRMTLGFVLRDLARRRVAVTLMTTNTTLLHGTIDRVGLDHLDLAIHDAGQPRRASAVRELRIVPIAALCRLTLTGDAYRVP